MLIGTQNILPTFCLVSKVQDSSLSSDKPLLNEAFCVMKIIPSEYIGKRFNKWVILEYAGMNVYKSRMFICQCDCGNIKTTSIASLLNGKSRSCGCIRIELFKQRATTHGLHKRHGLYLTWCSMINRCENPNNRRFEHYGAKGISVCKEWRTDYKSFYDWSISNGWAKGLSIERIENNKGYSPENCKWTPRGEQSYNKTNVPLIEHNGKKLCAQHWGKELNIPVYRIKKGLNDGKTIQQIIDDGRKRVRRTNVQIEMDRLNPKQKRYVI
jgi:hypothetical protein